MECECRTHGADAVEAVPAWVVVASTFAAGAALYFSHALWFVAGCAVLAASPDARIETEPTPRIDWSERWKTTLLLPSSTTP